MRKIVPFLCLSVLIICSCKSYIDQLPEEHAKALPEFAHSLRERRCAEQKPATQQIDELIILMISGGGSNGAFGAGVACGNIDKYTLPDFNIVTGVSTGALQATAVFIGKDGKNILKEAYTTITEDDVVDKYFFPLLQNSLSSNKRLKALINKYITDRVVDLVARQHRLGRRLYVTTTDLNNSRVVVWELSAIAASGLADRCDLYRKVLLASASVPAFYPPVPFTVTINGRDYCQHHSDSTTKSLFFCPWMLEEFDFNSISAYAIVNHQLPGEPRRIENGISGMLKAMVKDMLKARAYYGLIETAQMMRQHRAKFYFVAIPNDMTLEHDELDFDQIEMQLLFNRGYKMVIGGDSWLQELPLH